MEIYPRPGFLYVHCTLFSTFNETHRQTGDLCLSIDNLTPEVEW